LASGGGRGVFLRGKIKNIKISTPKKIKEERNRMSLMGKVFIENIRPNSPI
jgi:hypothetical protein